MTKPTIEELISRSFAARDIAHREHLNTKSYAAHKALDGFYNDVIGATDSVAEFYVGAFKELKPYEVTTRPVPDISKFLHAEAEWLEENLDELSQGSQSLSNLIQSLIEVYVKAVYMLRMK